MMPATPKPKFIMPLADPEYLGAMSIGTAQIGATTSSTAKNAAASGPASATVEPIDVSSAVSVRRRRNLTGQR